MVTENKTDAQVAAEAPAKIADTTAKTAEKVVKDSAEAGKRARTAAKRSNTRRAKAATRSTARSTRKVAAKAANTSKTSRTTARKTASAPRNERIQDVNFNSMFRGFDAFPSVAPFQSLFGDAGERSQEAVRRSQQVAEELADIARGNVEAIVEASRLAAEGARSLGQDVIAKSREGVEETAEAIRTLAEAKSPTEFVQRQGDLARASFDRMVAQSSRFTESMVKLAGEAIQPLSNRASANAERINTFVA